ncbi:MAG: methylmalonyl-CoA mutase small subunit [Planctomycetales bacterium]|nr:methylmalonyl-CoA mutase small subunit [Planctomycetales bacterium]
MSQNKALASEFTIREDFPPVSYDEWRRTVEHALDGAPFERKLVRRNYDGIDIQPLYTRDDQLGEGDVQGLPGFPPFVRHAQPLGAVAAGWDIRSEHAHPDVAVTNRAILDDLLGGVTSVQLQFDGAACNGLDADAPSWGELAGCLGVMIYSVDDLDAALADVDLVKMAVALDAGAAFLPAAALLAALWQRRGVGAEQAHGALNADPLASLALRGQLPLDAEQSFAQLAVLAEWAAENYPHVTSIGIDTSPYQNAGATAAQDIAFAMATGVEYLRALKLDIDTAARQMLFRIDLGTHHFLAIAKLRAARRLWSRIVEACGGSPQAAGMKIHARTSHRVLTRRDPYVNLLRNTTAVFAAGVAGAEVITALPLDTMNGLPDDFSRRIARNTVLVLQEEAHLNRIVDPAGGSWYLEKLTEQLADVAWGVFQETERQGGMLAALRSGWVADAIESAFAPRAKDIARRKEGITGVSEFPDVNEPRDEHHPADLASLRKSAAQRLAQSRTDASELHQLSKSPLDVAAAIKAADQGATLGQIASALGFHGEATTTVTPLTPRSFAQPYEELRDASDAWLDAHGSRPRVFLAKMGPVAHYIARATYAKNFFEAGGFEVVGEAGYEDADTAVAAFLQSDANIAVICSSDKLYAEIVPATAAALKQAGARTVVLAGAPGENADAWQAAGVDEFIFIKCDVLETLRKLLREEGVWQEAEV